jgi:serine protease Do
LVRAVEPDGPADKGGIEAGDIILRVDRTKIDKANDLPRHIGSLKPGSQASIQVWRRGATRELSITIGEFEPAKSAQAERKTEDTQKGTQLAQAWGLQVGELTQEVQRELKIRGGVRVENATEAAARAGLREGDVIVAVANAEIRNLADFDAVMAKVDKSRPLSVLFRRGEWAQYTLIRPSK